jgi:hypothetical protein
MVSFLKNMFSNFFGFLKRKKQISLGLYGPPNAGKSTLANVIIKDLLGEDSDIQFSTSSIEHETRTVEKVEKLELKKGSKKIDFTLIDTPGIATKIDFEDFVKKGMNKRDAKIRAKEATQGVIESIKWLDNVEAVIVVLDSTKNPYSQVNITLIGNLIAKNKKVIIVANKIDLKSSNVEKIKLVFPDYVVVPFSALKGKGIEELYEAIFKEFF